MRESTFVYFRALGIKPCLSGEQLLAFSADRSSIFCDNMTEGDSMAEYRKDAHAGKTTTWHFV